MQVITGAALLLVGFAPGAYAHPLTPALLELHERADGRVEVSWKTGTLLAPGTTLRPVLPPACRALGDPVSRPSQTDASVIATWAVRCPNGLVSRRVGVAGLDPASSQALLRITLDDGRIIQSVLTPGQPAVTIPARPRLFDLARRYGSLGVRQILTAPDHLLFILGLLLLVTAMRPLAWTITGFSVGHSLTLAPAVLGIATAPPGPTELAIALSVLVLALELSRPARSPTLIRRFPWAIACAFGLFHGLGFAAALGEAGLPAGEVPLALGAFNIGIEVGELAFIALALAVWVGLRHAPITFPRWITRVPVYAMGSIAVFWSLQRAAAML